MKDFYDVTDQTMKTVGPILFITGSRRRARQGHAAGFVEFMAPMPTFSPASASSSLPDFSHPQDGTGLLDCRDHDDAAGIMGMFSDSASMMTALGLNTENGRLLTIMAIGAGAMTVSHANDSHFWVVTNFTGMDPQDGYRTQTMMTFIVGIVSMAAIFLASLVLL